MKKFLSLFLAILMVLSLATTIVVSASAEEVVYETIEQLGDAFLADFNKYGETTATKENFQGDSSAPVKTALAKAEMLEKWNWLWVYMLAHLKETNPGATSAYLTDTYPVLEKMINGDTTAINDTANARTSIRSYIHGFLNCMKGCGEINTDFSKFSPDFSSVEEQNKLLAAANGADVPSTPEVDDGSIAIPLDGPWTQSWAEALDGEMTQTRIYYNKPGPHGPGGFMFCYGEGGSAEAVDISETDYLEFDVYVSDASIIADVEFSFELTSGGEPDKEESAKKFKGKDTGWKNGWNHVKWELSEFDVTNGEFDPTRWNFIRWYNDTELNATDWLQVAIKNVKFTVDPGYIEISLDGPWDQCWAEALDGEMTQTRIYYNKPGPHGPGGFMFRYGEGGSAEAVDISEMQYLEFDVFVSDASIIADVEFSFELTSSGTSDKEESAKKFRGQDTGWVNGWNHVQWPLYEFDAKNGEFDPTRWNFIRWYNDTALNATNWLQVAIKNVRFTPKTAEDLDTEEETITEHAAPLWGANTGWDNADGKDLWTIDNKNQLAGSGCISVNLKDRVDVMAPEKHFAPVDATGMDTLEFEIYLSDLAILDYFSNTDGAIEISSSDTSDSAERAYNFRNFMSYLKNNNPQVGWNHVAIKITNMEHLEGAAGPFDISAVNFLRIYWVHPKECDQDWILKFDNFRLTDAQKQIELEEEKKAQEILAKYADLVAKIEALKPISETEVTDANYAEFKAQYDAVKAEYDAVPEEEQQVISGKGYYGTLVAVKMVLENYEKELATLEENKDLIAALQALEAYKTSSAFTAENYAEMKATIEATRQAVEALTKAARNLLKNKGYIAHLEAAEKALPATAPAPNQGNNNTNQGGGNNTQSGGCGGVLTVGAVATMVLAGAWVTIAARKKEN